MHAQWNENSYCSVIFQTSPENMRHVNIVQNLNGNNIKTIYCFQFNIQRSEEWQLPTFIIRNRKWAEIEHNTFLKVKVKVLVPQLCPTLGDPMDCSPPGFSVHGILQVRTLEWVAMHFSRGVFPTQGLNLGLLHCRQILYHLSHIFKKHPQYGSGEQRKVKSNCIKINDYQNNALKKSSFLKQKMYLLCHLALRKVWTTIS